ncbi:MAG: prepilin peptidase [Candidatus Gribaldobacteria bacterium]|nr:prepilin peptidase [Candidatus Gribaldobacteria bacterium]
MLEILAIIATFIFGTIIGSFLNCFVYRLKENQEFIKGRSHCPKCQHQLSWLDLLPVVSFLFLGGKCRYCHQKIAWQYLIVELVTGVLFGLVFIYELQAKNFGVLNLDSVASLGFLTLILSFLIIIFIYDLKYYLIPDQIIYSAIIATLLFKIFFGWSWLILLAVLVAGGFFFLIWLVSKGAWMGFGDVKLAIFMGLFLGWPLILVALFLAFFIGAIIGLILMLLKQKGIKSEIPFGPFLIIATCLAFVWGNELISWYLNLIYY